jgi:hypothetical protein
MSLRGSSSATIRRLGRGALMPVAALIVHQLRYVLAFGGHAQIMLVRQGHTYLHSLVPWVVLLIGVGVGAFLWALGRALAGQRTVPRYGLSLVGLWIVCSGCLVAMYVTQELLEGVFATGHPVGLVGVFGYGGWWAVPVAVCIGLVLATIFHGARWVLDEVAQRRIEPICRGGVRPTRTPRWRDVVLPRVAPLAGGWSGRGPPC